MAIKQEANSAVILTIGAMSGLLILVIYLGVEAWFRTEERAEQDVQWQNNPNVWLDTLRENQRANLGGIDDAMKRVIETCKPNGQAG